MIVYLNTCDELEYVDAGVGSDDFQTQQADGAVQSLVVVHMVVAVLHALHDRPVKHWTVLQYQ